MPESLHAIDTTVYFKKEFHAREDFSGNPLKYEPTNYACDVVVVLLAAKKHGVGNMVLLSYAMGNNGKCIAYKEGAYMFRELHSLAPQTYVDPK